MDANLLLPKAVDGANLLLPKTMDGCESASAEGVGAWLARDLARSGSKLC